MEWVVALGHNISLIPYGAPEEIDCPYCGAKVTTFYEDFDTHWSDGTTRHSWECQECNAEILVRLEFAKAKVVILPKP
jgi:DNA-directed RNA polymerase subunit RPC12/RpoP